MKLSVSRSYIYRVDDSVIIGSGAMVEWEVAGETEVLGLDQSQCHSVHNSFMILQRESKSGRCGCS
jgi:hypothetical protein